jgi:uncharacterized protein YcaQ
VWSGISEDKTTAQHVASAWWGWKHVDERLLREFFMLT